MAQSSSQLKLTKESLKPTCFNRFKLLARNLLQGRCVSPIFTFRKKLSQEEETDEQTPTFIVESVESGNSSSLELLGVRNSSVFLVNATIWVEGITDRWYLRKMLDSYMEYLKEDGFLSLSLEEDVHYSFVEYGGNNITHWSFLDNEEHPN